MKFEKSTGMLDEILSRKRSPLDKIDLVMTTTRRQQVHPKKRHNYQQRETKEDLQNVPKNCKRITSPAGIEDLNSRKLRDQESIPSLDMKIFFLVTIMPAKTLDTKQFIAKSMQGITI